jgi:hypothetical protein
MSTNMLTLVSHDLRNPVMCQLLTLAVGLSVGAALLHLHYSVSSAHLHDYGVTI